LTGPSSSVGRRRTRPFQISRPSASSRFSRRESVSGVAPIAAATSFFDISTSTRGASPYCSRRKRRSRSSTSVVVSSTMRSARKRCRRISMAMKSSRKSSRASNARSSRRGSRNTVHSVSATAVTG